MTEQPDQQRHGFAIQISSLEDLTHVLEWTTNMIVAEVFDPTPGDPDQPGHPMRLARSNFFGAVTALGPDAGWSVLDALTAAFAAYLESIEMPAEIGRKFGTQFRGVADMHRETVIVTSTVQSPEVDAMLRKHGLEPIDPFTHTCTTGTEEAGQ
jgi:hypothetical protein